MVFCLRVTLDQSRWDSFEAGICLLHGHVPGAAGLHGAVTRQAPPQVRKWPGPRGLPTVDRPLPSRRALTAVPTCQAAGEARPARVPSITRTHSLASLSRVSRQPVLARRTLRKAAEERSFTKKHTPPDSMPHRRTQVTTVATVTVTKCHTGARPLRHLLETSQPAEGHTALTLISQGEKGRRGGGSQL